jgi:hypothetical protein
MSAIGDTIKEHPKATAAFVVVGLLVLFLLFRGGSSGAATSADSTDATDVQAATEAYAAQQQAQTQSQGIAASLQSEQDQTGAALQVATLTANSTDLANQLQAGVDLSQINAQQQTDALNISTSAQVQDTTNTLTAQVAEDQINSQVAADQISSNTTLGTASIVAGALVQESNNQAQVSLSEINAQNEATQAAQKVATQSWISKIF